MLTIYYTIKKQHTITNDSPVYYREESYSSGFTAYNVKNASHFFTKEEAMKVLNELIKTTSLYFYTIEEIFIYEKD